MILKRFGVKVGGGISMKLLFCRRKLSRKLGILGNNKNRFYVVKKKKRVRKSYLNIVRKVLYIIWVCYYDVKLWNDLKVIIRIYLLVFNIGNSFWNGYWVIFM